MSMFSLWLSQKRKLSKRGILDTRSGNRCLGVRKKFTYANTWGRDLTHFSLIPRSISVDTVMYFQGGGVIALSISRFLSRSRFLFLSRSLSFSLLDEHVTFLAVVEQQYFSFTRFNIFILYAIVPLHGDWTMLNRFVFRLEFHFLIWVGRPLLF